MTYPEALQYLDSFIDYEKQDGYNYKESFSLDRIRKLVRLLGDPQKGIKSIHVAGSKGKGSTSAFTQSILKHAGFKVGLYTSPHLSSFTERIRIDDTLISEADVARLLKRVKGAVDKMRADRPSFFEVYTAIAYLYFKERKVDFAVYEVGLGGRLDATNVIEPLVCAITPISYEHTDKLGKTLKEIASEKAGIIKDNVICVVAPQRKEALDAIKRIAKKKNAKLILVAPARSSGSLNKRDIYFKEISTKAEKEIFTVSGLSGVYPLLETRLLGSHQVVNAATAIGIVEALRSCGTIIPSDALRRGVESARWAGRLEVISRQPYIVFDGAQNRASASALAKAVRKIFRYKKLILVLGVSKDKDMKGILAELLPISDSVILTKSRIAGRAAEPVKIRELITKNMDCLLTSGVEEALEKARQTAKAEDLILVTGSLFVVGEARNA